jgi:hypothetical protein
MTILVLDLPPPVLHCRTTLGVTNSFLLVFSNRRLLAINEEEEDGNFYFYWKS